MVLCETSRSTIIFYNTVVVNGAYSVLLIAQAVDFWPYCLSYHLLNYIHEIKDIDVSLRVVSTCHLFFKMPLFSVLEFNQAMRDKLEVNLCIGTVYLPHN